MNIQLLKLRLFLYFSTGGATGVKFTAAQSVMWQHFQPQMVCNINN